MTLLHPIPPLKIYFNTMLMMLFICLNASAHGEITAIEGPTCDVAYYKSLQSKGLMEINRRTLQAENYIFKPDSVLDYSCFDVLSNIAADKTEKIFSEYHAGHCFPDSLDCTLERLVIAALQPYQQGNFNHTFLGGRSEVSRAAYSEDNMTMCTMMRDIWGLAKCTNFMLQADKDGFLSFSEYAATDPRQSPTPCTTNDSAFWTNNIQTAYTPTGSTAWFSKMLSTTQNAEKNHHAYLDPVIPSPAETTSCGPFIKTGILIKDDTDMFFRSGIIDGICPNPNCTPSMAGVCKKITF